MKCITQLIFLLFLIVLIISPEILYSQHLYYSDGTKYPLKISPNHVNVKFRSEINENQKKAFLSNLSEIDGAKNKRRLPNGFIALPVKTGKNIDKLNQSLRQSNMFSMVDPVYMSSYGTERFMFDEFMVRFKSNVSDSDIEKFSNRHNIEIVKFLDEEATRYTFRVTPQSDGDALKMANMYFDSLDCEWAVPDFMAQFELHQTIPGDLYFPKQYYLHNTGQIPIPGEGAGTVDADIDAPEAWDITLGSSDISIAVIDQGVQSHEDLPASRILPGRDYAGFTVPSPIDSDPSPDGNQAHGMAVAGIIAATHNTIGIAGIAPNSKIIPIKIFDHRDGSVEISKVASAVNWAWKFGNADIINGSFGSTANLCADDPMNYPVRDQINNALTAGRGGLGTVVVFSAGNFANRPSFFGCVAFPANMPGVLAVGAVNKSDEIQYYSPRGKIGSEIDVVAPSGNLSVREIWQWSLRGNVWSIDIPEFLGWNPGDYNSGSDPALFFDYGSNTLPPKGDDYPPDGHYTARFGGTSASAPQAAGVAALVLSMDPTLTQSEVITIIRNSAVDLGITSSDQGYGRLNAYNAVTYDPTDFPAVPQNLTVTQVPFGGGTYRPKLTWTKNTEPDLAGYKVYRSTDTEPVWSVAGEAPTGGRFASFIDYDAVIFGSGNNDEAHYKIRAFNNASVYSGYTPVKSIAMGILIKPAIASAASEMPKKYNLGHNRPNPFNPVTSIEFDLPEAGLTRLIIYNLRGREVAKLIDGKMSAGFHDVSWDASKMASGVYIYRLTSGNFVATKKMVLLK